MTDSVETVNAIEAAEVVEMRGKNAECQISERKSLCGAD